MIKMEPSAFKSSISTSFSYSSVMNIRDNMYMD